MNPPKKKLIYEETAPQYGREILHGAKGVNSSLINAKQSCVNGCFLNNSSNAHEHQLLTKKILRNFVSLRALTLKFHFGQTDRGGIFTEVSFTSRELK